MKIFHVELKKLWSFKEVYIALLFCLGLLSLFFYTGDLSNPHFDFWWYMHDFMPGMGFWFVAVMTVAGISRMLPYERESGIEDLLKTYKYGKTKLLSAKISAIFSYCFLMVTFFYLIAFSVYGKVYTIEGLHLPMESPHHLNFWILSNPVFTQGQYFLYEYSYMILTSFSFGLFVMIVSLFVKRSVGIMAICGGYFAALEFYDYLSYFVYLNFEKSYYLFDFLYTYGFNGMMGFKYLENVRLPEYWMIITSLFIPILIQIGIIILMYRRKSKW